MEKNYPYLPIFAPIKDFLDVYNVEQLTWPNVEYSKTFEILKVYSNFCSNFQKFRSFWRFKKCPIFWKISHQHQRNFSIVRIMLSSAHIKSFIYFSLSIPVVLKWRHPQNEQNRSSTLGPLHLNPMDILRSNFTRGFTSRISSRFLVTAVWILFLIP